MKFNPITEKHIMFFCEHCKTMHTGEIRYDFTTLGLVRIKGIRCDECRKITNQETLVKEYPFD